MTSPNSNTQTLAVESGLTGLTGHAAALQTALTNLSTLTVSQLVALFRQYQNVPNFQDLLKVVFPQIVLPHANAAAQVTAQWYNEIDPKSRFTATPVVNLPADRIDKTIAWALWAPTGNMSDSGTQTMAPPDVTLSRLAGSTKRMVFDASRDTVLSNTFQQGIRWARYASANACAFCRIMANKTGSSRPLYLTEMSAQRVVGRTVSLTTGDRKKIAAGLMTKDEALGRRHTGEFGQQRGTQALGEKWHDHCVPAGTVVSGPVARAAYRRPYKGEIVVLDTASGQKLTITANHPVLTDKGWVPAGFVQRGDNVIRCASGEARPVTVPDEYQQPALIEDVWGSLAVHSLSGVPGAPEQFHGDGCKGEVEIVGPYSLLRDRVQPEFPQPPLFVETQQFTGVDLETVPRRFDPAGFEFSAENGAAYADLGCDLLRGLGPQVELDCVVEARKVSFSGHVYNLDTPEGWYLSSSLVVSNCRCTAVPVPNGQSYEAPDYTAQWSEDYKAAVKAAKEAGQTKGKNGAIDFKAVLAHMRANTDAH